MNVFKKSALTILLLLIWLGAFIIHWSTRQFTRLENIDIPTPTSILFDLYSAKIHFVLATLITTLVVYSLIKKKDWLVEILFFGMTLLLGITIFSLWAISLLLAPLT